MDAVDGESLARLRHELRTPVNHILGYSELLIEDAGERHLEAFVPVLDQIRTGGHRLLETIQTHLSEREGSVCEFGAFQLSLRRTAAEVLEASTSLLDDLEDSQRQTFADLNAIAFALRRLLDFAGQGGAEDALSAEPEAPAPEEPASVEGVPAQRQQRRGKILIADDDDANRDLLRRRLECEGHEVVETKNGREVLDYLKDGRCDLVLLDILMPDIGGIQTLATLKQDPALRELPVIMISALDELRSVVQCIEMGAEDYLPKPFNGVLLRARVEASLEKKWLRDLERRRTEELEETLRLLESAQAQLALQASHDALTGLANRRSVDTYLESRAGSERPFSVIYIDLNGFKQINDTHGHQAGDDLLKQAGDRLRLAFRSADLVGRWGGDEFVALLDMSFTEAQASAARIAECFAGEFVIKVGAAFESVRVGAAVGIATLRPGESMTQVLQRADAEMYQQKRSRRAPARADRSGERV